MIKKNLVFALMLLCVLASCKKEKPKDVVLNAKPTAPALSNAMPALTMTQADGKQINMKELTGKVLLVCYNPGCDHCQREAKLIADNKDILSGYEVFFLTPETLEEADKFQKEYKLTDPNIHFGRSEVAQILPALGAINTVPTFFVYKDQSLVKRMEGEISITELRSVMQ
jgi:peroxiredoxin